MFALGPNKYQPQDFVLLIQNSTRHLKKQDKSESGKKEEKVERRKLQSPYMFMEVLVGVVPKLN